MLFSLRFQDDKAQVKTKVFERDIPESLLPVKSSTSRDFVIIPPQDFFNKKTLSSKQDEGSDGLYEIALPKTTTIDFIKEAEVSESAGSRSQENMAIY